MTKKLQLKILFPFMRTFPIKRRNITHQLFEGESKMFVHGFYTLRNPCNLDPDAYSQPVLYFVPVLGRRFNLNLLELHSVQMASQVIPHTYAFFSIACRMILHLNPSQVPSLHRKGYAFGRLIAGLSIKLFEHARSSLRDANKKQDFCRFRNYSKPRLPSEAKWESVCHGITVYCLHVWSAYPDLSNKKQQQIVYRKYVNTSMA